VARPQNIITSSHPRTLREISLAVILVVIDPVTNPVVAPVMNPVMTLVVTVDLVMILTRNHKIPAETRVTPAERTVNNVVRRRKIPAVRPTR
jgi:hypothetical protein